jgi:YbgC/YbaW family acyl-CoA thioester hydrolase
MDNRRLMTQQRTSFRHLERLRVRGAEVDHKKVVFNAHYLAYFDCALGGYWRALGLPYEESVAYLGGALFVRKATLEYQAPARLDDVLHVGMRCLRIGNSSLVFAAAVFRGDDLLVDGEMVHVFADLQAGASKPLPQELREAVQAFEAGKPMVEVRTGSWHELGDAATRVRHTVFIDEQRIAPELEWDGADSGCTHAVAFNRLGVPLATGRLLEHVPGVAKIGRMAVVAPMRGTGFGRQVLHALMDQARARGDREALLHAQLSALGFYAQEGFVQRGPVFDEAGIAHVEMVKTL